MPFPHKNIYGNGVSTRSRTTTLLPLVQVMINDNEVINKKHWDSAYLRQGYLTSVAIRIRDPDRHKNLIICSVAHC